MVREDGRLLVNDTIFTMIDINGHRQSFLSPISGRIIKLHIYPSDILSNGSIILEYEECHHTVVFKNLCSVCGNNINQIKDVQSSLSSTETWIKMEPSFPYTVVSHEEGLIYDTEKRNHLLRNRKLHLLIDLDQTLVHTTNSKSNYPLTSDMFSYQLTPVSPIFHTKLRPGMKSFLTNLHPFYQFYLVTFGDRLYANTIAKILDPNRTFFSHRILSRNECLSPTDKTVNLTSLFPSSDSLVCIIDDREDVWNSAPNLVQVKPYIWFNNVDDINDKFLPSRNENSTSFNENNLSNNNFIDTDHYLTRLEIILKHIHTVFYEAYDQWLINKQGSMPDLKQIIPNIRQEILNSVTLCFSHLMQQDYPLEKHRATIIAKAMGACVMPDLQIDSNGKIQITHIIAGKRTYKVYQAQQQKIHVVTPEWLLDCYEYWEKKPEENYIFTRNYQVRKSRLFTDRTPRITIKRHRFHIKQDLSLDKQSVSNLNTKIDDLSIEDSDHESNDVDQRPKKQQKITFVTETIQTTNSQYQQDDSNSDYSNEYHLYSLTLNDNDHLNSDEHGLSDDEVPHDWIIISK